MILNDEEIAAAVAEYLAPEADDMHHIMRYTEAIEAAVIRKLAAGVSMEPECWYLSSNGDTIPHQHIEQCRKDSGTWKPLYTIAAIAAARVQAIEECAKVCEVVQAENESNGQCLWEEKSSADGIRALMGKEAT